MTTPIERTRLAAYLLRLADACLILGQRHAELCGKAPELEEELALLNVGLDLFGQARLWLELVATLNDDGRDADALAFRRDAIAFRNVLLVEQPNGDFADTMVRQFLFDAWHLPMLEALTQCNEPGVVEIAAKAHKEVRYHLRRSSAWVIRLGDGTDESHSRVQRAIDTLWRFTGELVNHDELDTAMAEAGLAPEQDWLTHQWRETVSQVLEQATLAHPPFDAWMYTGGKVGHHTEHLGYLLAEMQFLPRAYPDAVTW